MADYDKDEVWQEWQDTHNMSKSELEDWLDTEESKNAGREKDNGETVGHEAGRQLAKSMGKNKEDLTEANWDRINQTVGIYHQKINDSQMPSGVIEGSAWHHALKNWAYDHTKK
jgi:hypothetical protein